MGSTDFKVRGSARRRTWALLRVTRAENCVMAGVATLVGASQARPVVPGRGAATLAGSVGAVVLVLAFGNVVNDLHDIEADRGGKGRRPLPSASLSPSAARWLAATMLVGAVATTLVTPHPQRIFVLAMCLVAALYSPALKGVPLIGNAVFAAQCGAILVFGANAAGRAGPTAYGSAVLVTVGILCVEVAKTVEDHDADAGVGVWTIAHVVAQRRHGRLVGAFAVAYLAVFAVLWDSARNPAVFALAAVPILPLLAFAMTSTGAEDPARAVPRYVVASKLLWPAAILGLVGR